MSFLSFLGLLPGAVAAGSAISSSLQRRVLLYFIKSILGHFLKDGDIKLDQIEAGIVEGRIEIRHVHLDTEAVTSLLPDLPLKVTDGLIGSILIEIPWSNIWKGELKLSITEVDARMIVTGSMPRNRDIAASINDSLYSAAEEALEDDDAEEAGPASIPAPKGKQHFITSYKASILNAFMARLSVQLSKIKLYVQSSEKLRSVGSSNLELRVDNITVGTGDILKDAPSADSLLQRNVQASGISLWLDDRRETEDEETNSDDDEHQDSVHMEASLANLKESMMDSFHTSASSESVYASAVQGTKSLTRSNSMPRRGLQQIAKLDSDPISMNVQAFPAYSEAFGDIDSGLQVPARLAFKVEAGVGLFFLDAKSIDGVLRFAEDVLSSLAPSSPSPSSSTSNLTEEDTTFELKVHVKSLHLICAYEAPEELRRENYQRFQESMDGFWSRSGKSHPYIGHLRLKMSTIQFIGKVEHSLSSTHFSVGDASIFEYLSPSLQEGRDLPNHLPILVMDPYLLQERSSHHSRTDLSHVSITSLDWRTASAATEKSKSGPYRRLDASENGWKVKIPSRRQSSSSSSVSSIPSLESAIQFKLSYREGGNLVSDLSLIPLHLFLDLSIINRLMPIISLSRHSAGTYKAPSIVSDMTSSYETILAGASNSIETSSSPANKFTLHCPLIRTDVRVPSYRSKSQTDSKLLGVDLRSGILTTDVVGIHLSNHSSPNETKVSPSLDDTRNQLKPSESCLLESISFYLGDPCSTRGHLFTSIGAMETDNDEENALPPHLQRIWHHEEAINDEYTAQYDGRLPLLRIFLTKALLDGLELIADDLSIWASDLHSWKEKQDSDTASDALRLIGSRFFGSKYSNLSLSSASTEVAGRRARKSPFITFAVLEVRISVLVPRQNIHEQERVVHINASDLHLHIDPHHRHHNSTKATISLATLSVQDQSIDGAWRTIVSQTVPPSLGRGAQHVLRLQIISTGDPESSFRGSQIDLLINNLTFTFDGDDSLMRDILVFGRSPEGAFENVEPNEVTQIAIRMKDVSILLAPQTVSSGIVGIIGNLSIRAGLVSHHPKTSFKVQLSDASVMATESLNVSAEQRKALGCTIHEVWQRRNFAPIVKVHECKSSIILSQLTRPEQEIKITKLTLDILACADTLQCVDTVISALQKSRMVSRNMARTTGSVTPLERSSIFNKLDENAFRETLDEGYDMDMLEDDIPRHPKYLSRGKAGMRKSNAELAADLEDEVFADDLDRKMEFTSKHGSSPKENIVIESDIVTMRLMDSHKQIQPTRGYFTNPALLEESHNISQQASSLRISVRKCDIHIRLFAGYDCQSTRSALEDEARKTRRRLQKIKQILDTGQTPDDSVEEATSRLMDSVHISLPGNVQDIDAAGMLQLMDEELGDQSDTVSSASTWKQFVPGHQSTFHDRKEKRQKRSKFARSKHSMIDIELKAIRLDFDAYVKGSPMRSRLAATVRQVRILDNIKTSTWQTFLTSMASQHSPLPQYAYDMVKVEVQNFGKREDPEVRCKVKINPLRLHVDQDALDFLKKFFAFEHPSRRDQPPAERSVRAQPFIQHAEVYPIRIKLDYKPKRVDYRQLREGKTIEMMNFFNFEKSEITLRHVTMRGISGWPKLFDTLNELWTPDVRSNQLADVLSGIAPVRSLVNVGNGVADLILLPIEQYQRDGRLGKGIRDGATRFVKSTVVEAARIGARLATGTQVILEQAENMLGAGGSEQRASVVSRSAQGEQNLHDSDSEDSTDRNYSRYANQPADLRQALNDAQQGMVRGFSEAAQTILAVPMEVYDRQSGEGSQRPVVRAVPIAVLKGAAGATGALSKALQGVQREFDGKDLAELEEKYKQPQNDL